MKSTLNECQRADIRETQQLLGAIGFTLLAIAMFPVVLVGCAIIGAVTGAATISVKWFRSIVEAWSNVTLGLN